MRGVFRHAHEAFYKVLDRHTLADLLRPRERLAAVLFKPASRAKVG